MTGSFLRAAKAGEKEKKTLQKKKMQQGIED